MVVFLVKTEILPFDPQAGMKSEQTLTVDFTTRTVRSIFRTGTTRIGPISLGSIRDRFTVSSVSFSGSRVTFTAFGSTASGVGFLPNIDYRINFTVDSTGSGSVDGSHDGYPAYIIRKGGTFIYSYRHRSAQLWRLAGSSDVTFGPITF